MCHILCVVVYGFLALLCLVLKAPTVKCHLEAQMPRVRDPFFRRKPRISVFFANIMDDHALLSSSVFFAKLSTLPVGFLNARLHPGSFSLSLFFLLSFSFDVTCSYSKPTARVIGNVYVNSRIKAPSSGALWLCFLYFFSLASKHSPPTSLVGGFRIFLPPTQ